MHAYGIPQRTDDEASKRSLGEQRTRMKQEQKAPTQRDPRVKNTETQRVARWLINERLLIKRADTLTLRRHAGEDRCLQKRWPTFSGGT